jgi:hypothetical protein
MPYSNVANRSTLILAPLPATFAVSGSDLIVPHPVGPSEQKRWRLEDVEDLGNKFVSEANEFSGSQTGSQRRPALIDTGRRPVTITKATFGDT